MSYQLRAVPSKLTSIPAFLLLKTLYKPDTVSILTQSRNDANSCFRTVTEKLFTAMLLPTVVVYYGAPNVPNITTTPSFIKASDFQYPKDLADYLLYLDANPEEYAKYHAWRSREDSFLPEYLELLEAKNAGPEEILAHEHVFKRGWWLRQRAAQCCRLCDANYVKSQAVLRNDDSLVAGEYTKEDIEQHFYHGMN